jgi:hypothetical protein
MSSDALQAQEGEIKGSIILLERAVGGKDIEQIDKLSIRIQRQIMDRNNKAKFMKP